MIEIFYKQEYNITKATLAVLISSVQEFEHISDYIETNPDNLPFSKLFLLLEEVKEVVAYGCVILLYTVLWTTTSTGLRFWMLILSRLRRDW